MFVDIHTHHSTASKNSAIRNLTFQEAKKVFATSEKGLFSFGIHPWFIDENWEESVRLLESWIYDKRFIAIGECGLDKNSKAPFELQLNVLKLQISLSEKIQKPLIVHCVGYFNELFELKKQLHPTQLWIIHGFRGKPELAKQALKNGCSLSFGEYFNAESVRFTPIEKLFVETDESLMPIEQIYEQIAQIKSIQ